MTYALLIIPFALVTIAVTLATIRRPGFGPRMAASAMAARAAATASSTASGVISRTSDTRVESTGDRAPARRVAGSERRAAIWTQ